MKKAINLTIKISFTIYILVLCFILFLGNRGRWEHFSILQYAAMQMNLVPFETIALYIRAMVRETINPGIAIANLLGNFLLFMPMGIYLPFFFKKIRTLLDYVLYMIPVLSLVELVQLLTKRGSFDIDDLILNLAGAIVAFLIWKSEAFQKICKKIININLQDSYEKEIN